VTAGPTCEDLDRCVTLRIVFGENGLRGGEVAARACASRLVSGRLRWILLTASTALTFELLWKCSKRFSDIFRMPTSGIFASALISFRPDLSQIGDRKKPPPIRPDRKCR